MNARHATRLVRAGHYVAEVEVELIVTDDEWSPYLSVEDACKLDDVRDALERGGINSALRLARVFTLTSVAV
jgi:hypothetical protein